MVEMTVELCLFRRLDDEYDEISDKLSTSLCLSDLSTWRSADLKGTHLKNKSLRRSLGYDNSSGRVTHRVRCSDIISGAWHQDNVTVS